MLKYIWPSFFFISVAFAQVSDRPGAGDSPDSQKEGTWRVETSLAGYNEWDGVKNYNLAQTTYASRGFKSSELQLGQVGGINWMKVEQADTDTSVGELSLRYKYSFGHLFCESCRFGLLAAITAPEEEKSRLHNYEKALSVPMSFDLSPKFSLGVNFAWTHVNDLNSTDSSFVLNYALADKIGVFVQQTISTNKVDEDEVSFTPGFGAAYLWQKNWQMDIEYNQGISSVDKTSDLQVGMTYWFN